jgi:hypothetical protein
MPGFKPKSKAIVKIPVELMDPVSSSDIKAVVTTEKIKGMFEEFEPVFANEIDEKASITYIANHKHKLITKDINELSPVVSKQVLNTTL